MKNFPSYTASTTSGYTIEQWQGVTFVLANSQTCIAPVVTVDGSGYDRGTIARAEQALTQHLRGTR